MKGMIIMLEPNERLEDLGAGYQAIVTRQHTFGADAVLLAYFSQPAKGHRVCDLGTGCGIIPLLWCKFGFKDQIDAFEIQSAAADLAERAARHNGFNNIRIFNRDLRMLNAEFADRYDLIACNPPYKAIGTGRISRSVSAQTARHETACTLDDVVCAASRMLKGSGRLCLCHRTERLTDILTSMRSGNIEPKRIRFVQQNGAKEPWLVLVEGKKSAKPGLRVEPVLLMEENGEASREIRYIYGMGND